MPLESQVEPPAIRTFPLGSRTVGAERVVDMLPVVLKAPVAGSYNSALFRYVHVLAVKQLIPPAIKTLPLFSRVALCKYRLVFKPLGANTAKGRLFVASPSTATATGPLVAPVGTGTVMLVSLQAVGVAMVPLNETELLACVDPKPAPVMVTEVPTDPLLGESADMVGGGMIV